MARIQGEYDLVERPFCQQLQAMGWEWLEGDVDVPELPERASFAEVLLKERLAAKLREINLRDGKPWLDDARIAKAIRDLEQAAGHRLMEIIITAASSRGCSTGRYPTGESAKRNCRSERRRSTGVERRWDISRASTGGLGRNSLTVYENSDLFSDRS